MAMFEQKNTFKKKGVLLKVLNTKKKRLSRYILIGFLLLILYVYGFGDYGLYRYVQLNSELSLIKQEISSLEDEMTQLEQEKVLFRNKDPEYLQRIARERFGLVKEGEKIYKLAPRTQK